MYNYIYIYIYGFVTETVRTFFMFSVVDIIQRFFYGFRRWFCLWFPSWQGTFFMVSVAGFLYVFCRGRKTLFMVSVAGCLMDSAAARGSKISERIERFLVSCVVRTGFRRWCVYGFRRWLFLWLPSWQGRFVNGFRRCFCSWFSAATGPRLSLRWKPKKEIRTFP